jgi:hypothetical protein
MIGWGVEFDEGAVAEATARCKCNNKSIRLRERR